MHELNSLDPGRFHALLNGREAAFAAAPADFPAQPYGVNALAEALHPRQQFLTVSDVQIFSDHCRTYTLRPDRSRGTEALAVFQPGQYISVRLDTGTAVTTRTYTLCSSPARRESYQIAVVDTDAAAHHIITTWAVGAAVEASAPLGEFCYEGLRDAPQVVAVAEGTGFLPFCSMARAIADGSEDFALHLCYLGPAQHLEALAPLAAACPKLHLTAIPGPEALPALLPQGDYTVFLALSLTTRARLLELLAALPHRPKNIRQSLCHAPADHVPPVPVRLTVRLHRSETTVSGQSNETVLTILERSGIAAPSRCRSGHCGWCRARLLSGEVWLPPENDGRRLADLPHNIIHPCCTYPRSDLSIEVAE